MERLKRIFTAYFSGHETYLTTKNADLEVMVEERARACAMRYRQKLRRLHLSHTDYYLDTIQRLAHATTQNPVAQSTTVACVTARSTTVDYARRRADSEVAFLSVSVV